MKDKSLTEKEAFNELSLAVNEFALKVEKLLVKQLNQHQFNAIVSFAYNCGITALSKSTLLKKVNANPKDQTIENEFLRWNKIQGKPSKGLTKRRMLESKVYFMNEPSLN